MIDVCLLGNGGMMPLPDRPLSAALIRSAGEVVLWDCGENTQVNWRACGWSYRATSTILLSHLHADHVAGLPGVLFQLAHSGRTQPVTILGPVHTYEIVGHLVTIVGRLPYELRVVHLSGGESFGLPGDLTVSALAVEHRVPCLAYRLDLPRAPRFDPDRARELGVPIQQWSRLQRGESVDGVRPAQVLGAPRRGLRVSLVTDTSLTDELGSFIVDSDLLISEAMYASDEQAERAEKRGHMTARQAARLAAVAKVRRLWLTHFSPSVEDLDELLAVARQECSNVEIGRQGLATTLRFEDAESDER